MAIRPKRGRPKRARRLVCALLTASSIIFNAPSASADTSIEFAVKAAYIYKFAPYVEWPANAFPSPGSPLTICVVGDDAVGALLDQAAAGQHAGARPIVVRHLAAVARDGGCQIVYIADPSAQAVAGNLDTLRGAPVLTVTDSDRTPGAAGIIGFTIQDNRVRFNVDDAAAAASGLVISSKLLGLAHAVKQRP